MIVQFEVMCHRNSIIEERSTRRSAAPARWTGADRRRRKARSLDSGRSCHDCCISGVRDVTAREAPLRPRVSRTPARRTTGSIPMPSTRRDLRADTNPSASDRCAPPPSAPQTARMHPIPRTPRSDPPFFPHGGPTNLPILPRLQASHSNFRTSSCRRSRDAGPRTSGARAV